MQFELFTEPVVHVARPYPSKSGSLQQDVLDACAASGVAIYRMHQTWGVSKEYGKFWQVVARTNKIERTGGVEQLKSTCTWLRVAAQMLKDKREIITTSVRPEAFQRTSDGSVFYMPYLLVVVPRIS